MWCVSALHTPHIARQRAMRGSRGALAPVESPVPQAQGWRRFESMFQQAVENLWIGLDIGIG